jgi:hypothetical protein
MSGVAEVSLDLALVNVSTRRRLWMFGLVVLSRIWKVRKKNK